MNTKATSVYLLTGIIAAIIGFSAVPLAQATDWWPFGKSDKDKTTEEPQRAQVVINEEPISRNTQVTTSFASIIEKASPSVVSIKTEQMIETRSQIPPMLREFLGIPDQQNRSRPRYGLGSGVVVSKDGYILTNNHVIEGADQILIEFKDDSNEYTAEIVGVDPATDLAVLKIDRSDIPAATLGNSDHLRVGDIVLAIGNPFGLSQTVTMGIVSATGRETVMASSQLAYQDFIQTDASINQGNSGGALIDAEGRLIGINAAILSRTGENLGIGFAIPINMAHDIMTQLIETGRVSRGYLGVMPTELDPANAEFLGLEGREGVQLTQVIEGTPAAKAGLQTGDVVLKVDGTPVTTANKFRLLIAEYPPGSKVEMTIFRDGKEKNVTVTLEERPDFMAEAGQTDDTDDESETTGKLFKGITISDLTARTRDQLRVPEDVAGALVTAVDPDSPAGETDLEPGMVIMEISTREATVSIASAQEAIEFSRSSQATIARLYVWHRGAYRYIVLKADE